MGVTTGEITGQRQMSKFNWKVANFDTICPVSATNFDEIKSPKFSVKDARGVNSKWSVSVHGKSGQINCYLELDEWSRENLIHINNGQGLV